MSERDGREMGAKSECIILKYVCIEKCVECLITQQTQAGYNKGHKRIYLFMSIVLKCSTEENHNLVTLLSFFNRDFY